MLHLVAQLRNMSRRDLARAFWTLLVAASTQNLATKGLALVIALVVFGVTRDEIQRVYSVPVRAQQDPDRILTSKLPAAVDVELRGPWTDLSPLTPRDLGYVLIDLKDSQPGPLVLDSSTLDLPAGVQLVELRHEAVDLRFDPVIEREVPLVPHVIGEVAADYERIRVIVEPVQWRIRGAATDLEGIAALELEPVDVSGATADLEKRVGVVRPSEAVQFLGVVDASSPRATIRVEVRPLPGEVELAVHVQAAILAALPELSPAEATTVERVTVRGPKPTLHRVEALELPLVPRVTVERGKRGEREPTQVEIRFEWGDEVDADTRAALRIEPAVVRMSVAARGPGPAGGP